MHKIKTQPLPLYCFLFCLFAFLMANKTHAGSCDTISCDAKITNLYAHGVNGKVYIGTSD